MSRDPRRFDILRKHPIVRAVRGGLTAAGVVAALSAGSAHAQEASPQSFVEGGAFVGYTWGVGGGVTWGLEARAGLDFREQWACSAQPAFSTAGVARFSFVDLRPQLHFGGQAGVVSGMASFMGEVGLGYRWGRDGGLSVPLGMELQIFAAQTFLRADPVLRELAIGGGFTLPARDGEFSCVVAGRALHDEEGHAPLAPSRQLDAPSLLADLDPLVAESLRVEWAHRAAAEWASVPAFVQLADQLERVDGPRSLVARAHQAADDELRHAIGTARASMAYGGSPIALGPVSPNTRAPLEADAALVRLAVESWVDGCLGEGKAALGAAREAERAPQAEMRALQETIARDEARHAELAWDVLAWTMATGGDDVRHAVHAVREATPTEPTGARTDMDLSAHGVFGESAHQILSAEHREHAQQRLDLLLG